MSRVRKPRGKSVDTWSSRFLATGQFGCYVCYAPYLSSRIERTHSTARVFKIWQGLVNFFFFNPVVNTKAYQVVILLVTKLYHGKSNSLWHFDASKCKHYNQSLSKQRMWRFADLIQRVDFRRRTCRKLYFMC